MHFQDSGSMKRRTRNVHAKGCTNYDWSRRNVVGEHPVLMEIVHADALN